MSKLNVIGFKTFEVFFARVVVLATPLYCLAYPHIVYRKEIKVVVEQKSMAVADALLIKLQVHAP